MEDCLEDIARMLMASDKRMDELGSDLRNSLDFYTKFYNRKFENSGDLNAMFECIDKIAKYVIEIYKVPETIVEHDFRRILKRLIDEILFSVDLSASDKTKIFDTCEEWVNSQDKRDILAAFRYIAGELRSLEKIIIRCNLDSIERSKEKILRRFISIDKNYGSKCIDYSERACLYSKAIVEKHIQDAELSMKLREFFESYPLANKLPSAIALINVIDTLLPNYFNYNCINLKNVKLEIRSYEEEEKENVAVYEESVRVKSENDKPTIKEGDDELRKIQDDIRAEESGVFLRGEDKSNREEVKYEELSEERYVSVDNESDASSKGTINLKLEVDNLADRGQLLVTIKSFATVDKIVNSYLSTIIGKSLPLEECRILFCFQFLIGFEDYILSQLKQDFHDSTEFVEFISFKCLFRRLLTYSEADQFPLLEILRSITNRNIRAYEYLFNTSHAFNFAARELSSTWKDEFCRKLCMLPYRDILTQYFESNKISFEEYTKEIVNCVRIADLPSGIGGITLKNKTIYIQKILR